MHIFEIYKDFINKEVPDESIILSTFNMEEISELGVNKPNKINDAMGFGGGVEIISNIAAFIFLVIAQKIVETGANVAKDSILNILVENREKIIAILKRRYGDRHDIAQIIDKIISFLQK